VLVVEVLVDIGLLLFVLFLGAIIQLYLFQLVLVVLVEALLVQGQEVLLAD
jgi:hypothetical protein